jgi:hypothetical protein
MSPLPGAPEGRAGFTSEVGPRLLSSNANQGLIRPLTQTAIPAKHKPFFPGIPDLEIPDITPP